MKYRNKDYDNSDFYNSTKWRKVSQAYLASRNYLCERCGAPARICHHRTWLNATNVHDPHIAYDWANLEALCIDCHNAEHSTDKSTSVTVFDDLGGVATVKDSDEVKQYKEQAARIDRALAKAQALREATQSHTESEGDRLPLCGFK